VAIDLTGLPVTPLTALDPWLNELSPARLRAAKYAYTTRYVADAIARQPSGYFLLAAPETRPHPGDVVLAEVVELGHHKKLESPLSRRAQMFVGDEIVVAYGNRYAPDQYEAEVPDTLEEAHLVAAGGVVGLVTALREGLDEATIVRPLGLLCDGEGALSLSRVAPKAPLPPLDLASPHPPRPPVIALVGTSMNSGKTTALASLALGLTRSGMRVAAGKATGTGAGGDPGMYRDGGAQPVMDFTDFGYASTYRLDHESVVAVFTSLVNELASSTPDVILIEIADGAYQIETARLLDDPVFSRYVDQVVFTCGEALSAVSGMELLRRHNLHVAAVSGRLTSSPLAVREARAVLDVPVVDTLDLCEPEVAVAMLPAIRVAS
jgi:molybdopterin-guanine dinucleotide biosynthesis protein